MTLTESSVSCVSMVSATFRSLWRIVGATMPAPDLNCCDGKLYCLHELRLMAISLNATAKIHKTDLDMVTNAKNQTKKVQLIMSISKWNLHRQGQLDKKISLTKYKTSFIFLILKLLTQSILYSS